MKPLLVIIGSIAICGILIYLEKRRNSNSNISFISREHWQKPTSWIVPSIIGIVLLVTGIMFWKPWEGGKENNPFTPFIPQQSASAVVSFKSQKITQYGDTTLLNQGDSLDWYNSPEQTYFAPVERAKTIRLFCQSKSNRSSSWIAIINRDNTGKVTNTFEDVRFDGKAAMYVAKLLSKDSTRVIFTNKPEQ